MSLCDQAYNHFFMIKPDAAASDLLARLGNQLCNTHRIQARLRPCHIFHVSLQALPEETSATPGLIRAACAAAERAASKTSPFDVTFDQVLSYRGSAGRRPLVLTGGKSQNAGLLAFHKALGMELRASGIPAQLNISPHLTLLYGDHELKETIETVKWTVREFALVRSHVGLTRYDHLERWRLQATAVQSPADADARPASHMTQAEFQW